MDTSNNMELTKRSATRGGDARDFDNIATANKPSRYTVPVRTNCSQV